MFSPVLQATPGVPFFAAVAIAAWYGGLWPGLAASGLSLAGLIYSIYGLAHSESDASALNFVGFLVTAWLIVMLSERLRASERRFAALAGSEQAARAEAELAVRTRNHVLTSVAHDLRQPLTALKGYAQLLRPRAGSPAAELETVQRLAGRIEDSATRMDAMLAELLEAAQLENRQSHEAFQPTDLALLLNRVVTDLQAPDGRVVVPLVSGDLVGSWHAARLHRALLNLIGNAIKYSPAHSVVSVGVTKEHDGQASWAAIAIGDEGIGIPAADVPKLSEPFYRASNARDGFEGTGLGLAGAREIVEQHGGSLQVQSRQGHGTTVTVRLPLSRSALHEQSGIDTGVR